MKKFIPFFLLSLFTSCVGNDGRPLYIPTPPDAEQVWKSELTKRAKMHVNIEGIKIPVEQTARGRYFIKINGKEFKLEPKDYQKKNLFVVIEGEKYYAKPQLKTSELVYTQKFKGSIYTLQKNPALCQSPQDCHGNERCVTTYPVIVNTANTKQYKLDKEKPLRKVCVRIGACVDEDIYTKNFNNRVRKALPTRKKAYFKVKSSGKYTIIY